MNKIWAYIGGVVIIGLLILAGIFYFNYQSLKNENFDLIDKLAGAEKLHKVDSMTYQRQGAEINELKDYIAHQDAEWRRTIDRMNRLNQTPITYTIVKTETKIDTLFLPADSLVIKEGIEWAVVDKTTEYYNMSFQWRCNPYELLVNQIYIPDSLQLVEYEQEDGRQGIYVKNNNPFVHINDVKYLFKKRNDNQFDFGVGLGTNNQFDLTAMSMVRYNHIGVWGTFNIVTKEKDFINDKVTGKDWRLGLLYLF